MGNNMVLVRNLVVGDVFADMDGDMFEVIGKPEVRKAYYVNAYRGEVVVPIRPIGGVRQGIPAKRYAFDLRAKVEVFRPEMRRAA